MRTENVENIQIIWSLKGVLKKKKKVLGNVTFYLDLTIICTLNWQLGCIINLLEKMIWKLVNVVCCFLVDFIHAKLTFKGSVFKLVPGILYPLQNCAAVKYFSMVGTLKHPYRAYLGRRMNKSENNRIFIS